MAAPNRYAIREAGIATFYGIQSDGTRGKALFQLDTLKMGEVETSGETVYARGGRGNAKLVGFSSDREARITLEDAIFTNDTLAALTGNTVKTQAQAVIMNTQKTINASLKITLEYTPVSIINVYKVGNDGAHGAEVLTASPATTGYALTGKEITFGSSHVEGQMVKVYYTVNSSADTKTVVVSSDQFGGTYYLVVDILVRDAVSGKDFYGQFVAERAKIEDNFSFNFNPDGDPSVLNIPIEILKHPAKEEMWRLVIFDQDAIA